MAPDELLFYGSGGGSVAKLLNEHRLKLRISARDRVPNDDDVRPRLKVLRAIPLAIRDPHLLEPGRHWRGIGLVPTGNRVAPRFEQRPPRTRNRTPHVDAGPGT